MTITEDAAIEVTSADSMLSALPHFNLILFRPTTTIDLRMYWWTALLFVSKDVSPDCPISPVCVWSEPLVLTTGRNTELTNHTLPACLSPTDGRTDGREPNLPSLSIKSKRSRHATYTNSERELPSFVNGTDQTRQFSGQGNIQTRKPLDLPVPKRTLKSFLVTC